MNLKAAEIDRFLSAPPAGVRAAVIFGRDRGGVRERADRLASVIAARPDDPFDVDLLTEEEIEADPARLQDALCAFSLFGGRRLVRVRLTAPRADVDRAVLEAFKAHESGALNPDAFLLIEAGDLSKGSGLRGAAERAKSAALVPVYEEDQRSLQTLVKDALAAEGLSIAPDALAALGRRFPKERAVVRSEIERLILFLGPGSGMRGTLAELADFFGVEPEASLRNAAADAFAGRMLECQSGLRRARAEGEGGVAALRALSSHLARLRRARALIDAGRSEEEVSRELSVFWKEKDDFFAQTRAWPAKELIALSTELLAAEESAKSAGAPDDLIAERLALQIAARGRRRRGS